MKRTEEEAAAKGAAKRRGRPAKSGAGTAKTASKPASKGAAKTAGAKGAAQGSAKSAAKDTAKSTAKTGAVGRGRKPAAAQVPERVLWRPELDAAMPQGPELERLADRLLRDPKEVRAALAALVLTCSGDGTGDGANPAALPEEAAKRTEELRALCGEGSALAGLFCGVMHWHGQYLPRDIGAAARLLEKARQAGFEACLLTPAAKDADAGALYAAGAGLAAPGALATFFAIRLASLHSRWVADLNRDEVRALLDGLLHLARRGSWKALEQVPALRESPTRLFLNQEPAPEDAAAPDSVSEDSVSADNADEGSAAESAAESAAAKAAGAGSCAAPDGNDADEEEEDRDALDEDEEDDEDDDDDVLVLDDLWGEDDEDEDEDEDEDDEEESLIFRPAEVSLMETMAEDGCVGAMHGLGTFWRKRVGGRNPSRSPARKLASTWLEKAWKAGDMDAGAELGVLRIETSRAYTTGLGPFPDRVVEQLRRLAEQDSPRGCDQYAIVTYKMTLSREDKEQCFAWMRRAAELGWCENNLDIAVRLARGFTDFHWNVSKEDGMALLRHGAACGLDEFAAEYAPFRMCGLDGEAADVPGGLAMLEKAAANGSLTAMARLADILTQGLFGIGPDMRRGLALAAKAMSGGSGRAASLLAFATLGLFGEECRALSPMPWWEARTRLTSDPERTDPLFTVFRSLWPDRAAELADSIFPIGMSSAIGAGEADDGETDDEFLKEKLNHVGYETEMLWGEALRFADMAVLQLVARAFAEMPDRVRARHLAEGFSNGLLPFGAKPLPLGEVRAVMARALAKPAAVVREYDVR